MYGLGARLQLLRNTAVITPCEKNNASNFIYEPFLKPVLSSRIPAMLGPMKAPRANVLVHNPLMRP
ncbi:hypothetical protein ALC60_08292 [Trachymyrmex zeteki]|uniref:Uncharacterized protein n=1 Tax=Mycetomoellerius zeteki TaxID=64791 RepID=A0A151WXN7_9HYME|nr:hypothetical protein ALC60_08292 [Trachymyrmex zeteki]